MTNSIPARADRRALFGAAALGSCLGLALGGAYLAGGLARAANVSSSPDAAGREIAAAQLRSSVDLNGERTEVRPSNAAGLRFVPGVAPFNLRGAAHAARDQECLSQAVYYEARGEGDTGMAAVAQVVLNRVRHPNFPKSVCAVVFQGCQFSFACDGSVRRGVEIAAWRRAERIAVRALSGSVMSDVGAATDFRVAHIPAFGLQRVAQIGSHVFYRFAGRLGHAAALTGQPQPSAAAQVVKASFAPPSAEQVLAVGAKVVERAAAAVVGSSAHAAVPAGPAAAPMTNPSPSAEASPVPAKPAVVKAAESTPPVAPAPTPAA